MKRGDVSPLFSLSLCSLDLVAKSDSEAQSGWELDERETAIGGRRGQQFLSIGSSRRERGSEKEEDRRGCRGNGGRGVHPVSPSSHSNNPPLPNPPYLNLVNPPHFSPECCSVKASWSKAGVFSFWLLLSSLLRLLLLRVLIVYTPPLIKVLPSHKSHRDNGY